MELKKICTGIYTTLLLVSLYAAGTACAQSVAVKYDIEVETRIPHPRFFVTPVNAWHHQAQTLDWNSAQKTLMPMRPQQLNMKSTMGSIRAYLVSPPYIVNEDKKMELVVKINDQALGSDSTTPVEIYSLADAGREKRVWVDVRALPNGDDGVSFKPGGYMGVVTMQFETTEP